MIEQQVNNQAAVTLIMPYNNNDQKTAHEKWLVKVFGQKLSKIFSRSLFFRLISNVLFSEIVT